MPSRQAERHKKHRAAVPHGVKKARWMPQRAFFIKISIRDLLRKCGVLPEVIAGALSIPGDLRLQGI